MIICEIGINHLGSEARATKMVNQILKTKADAITFQIPASEYTKNLKIKTKELKLNYFKKIVKKIHSKKKKVGFAASDELIIDKLNSFGCDFWKILSRDFYNKTLVKKIKQTKKKTYISTYFSGLSEIKKFKKEFGSKGYFIHTSLSHDYEDVNLSAISTMQKNIDGKKIAFGMHSPDIKVLYYSQIYNPESFFIYVKTNEKIKFPDDMHALKIKDIDLVINNLNLVKISIGTGRKQKVVLKNIFDTGKIK